MMMLFLVSCFLPRKSGVCPESRLNSLFYVQLNQVVQVHLDIIPRFEKAFRRFAWMKNIYQGLSKHQEMGFTPVTKMLQSNDGI